MSEEPPLHQSPEHPLSKPLVDAADTILWHRRKFWKIVEAYKRERLRFEEIVQYPAVEPVERLAPEIQPDARVKEGEKLDEFARRHPARPRAEKRYRAVGCCPEKRPLVAPPVEDPAAAAEYVGSLKRRGERAVACQEAKLKTQRSMTTEAWERLLRKQDRSFDEALGRRVLDQSRYEKQMIGKLCEVRNVRSRIVENRRLVDAMLLAARESEQRLRQDRRREVSAAEAEEVETEDRRMRELRRRIREEKARRLREKRRGICAEVTRDLADIALKAAAYRRAAIDVPRSVWSEWRTLFLNGQPIFELARRLGGTDEETPPGEGAAAADRRGPRKNGGEEGEREGEETRSVEEGGAGCEEGTSEDEERRELIRLADFEAYRDLASPWDEFVAARGEEVVEGASGLGRVVLGHVVHRLLETLHPGTTAASVCPVPRVNARAVVLGVTSAAAREQLRELLKKSGVRAVRMEDAINHCLESYKREMADVEYIDLSIVSATARDAKRLEDNKSKTDGSEVKRRAKARERTKATAATTTPRQDTVAGARQTETPGAMPRDDPVRVLSDAAYIGSRINEKRG